MCVETIDTNTKGNTMNANDCRIGSDAYRAAAIRLMRARDAYRKHVGDDAKFAEWNAAHKAFSDMKAAK